jgi:anti-sigma28 factor (negative regulator of flagellin synthesis)
MKVTQTNTKSIGALSRSSGGPPALPGKPAGAAAQTQVADQTEISNLSTYLAAAMSGSPAHVAKLGSLGEAVSNSEYSVDAGAVSEDIIQHSILFSAAW